MLGHRIQKYPDSLSTRYRIRCRFIFSTLESGFKNRFAVEFTGRVWTEAVSGKKKLRIHKYPDTYGRDLMIDSPQTH